MAVVVAVGYAVAVAVVVAVPVGYAPASCPGVKGLRIHRRLFAAARHGERRHADGDRYGESGADLHSSSPFGTRRRWRCRRQRVINPCRVRLRRDAEGFARMDGRCQPASHGREWGCFDESSALVKSIRLSLRVGLNADGASALLHRDLEAHGHGDR